MFCPKCGSNNLDQRKFCAKCGAELIANQASSGAPPIDAKTPVEVLYQSQFVSPDEHAVAILGNSMAQTFLSTGDLSSSFAILSDRRVYFHGKAFVRNGKRFSVRKEKRIVDVQDVTGTGFIYNNPIWMRVLAIVFAILVPPSFFLAGSLMPAFLWISILFFCLYKINRKTLFEISFAGGGIAFNVRWFPDEESQNFQNALKQTSDAAKAQGAQRSTCAPSGSVADEIEKLARLLSQGVITQEEFVQQKRTLISSQRGQ